MGRTKASLIKQQSGSELTVERNGLANGQAASFFDRREAGKHVLGFRERVERHAIAHGAEFFPHRQNIRVFVRGIDFLTRFPFRHFDDGAVAGAHDGRGADDHVVMREGLRRLIDSESDMEVVCEAADGDEAVEKAGQLCPDVAVLDVSMRQLSGPDAARRIKKKRKSQGRVMRRVNFSSSTCRSKSDSADLCGADPRLDQA